MPVTKENVASVFSYHAPDDEQRTAYEAVRTAARRLAEVMLEVCPASADQQAAIRLLRESVMTCNAAIALRGAI